MFIHFGGPKAHATLGMTCEAEERRGAIARPAILQHRAVLDGRACHLEFALVFGATKQHRLKAEVRATCSSNYGQLSCNDASPWWSAPKDKGLRLISPLLGSKAPLLAAAVALSSAST